MALLFWMQINTLAACLEKYVYYCKPIDGDKEFLKYRHSGNFSMNNNDPRNARQYPFEVMMSPIMSKRHSGMLYKGNLNSGRTSWQLLERLTVGVVVEPSLSAIMVIWLYPCWLGTGSAMAMTASLGHSSFTNGNSPTRRQDLTINDLHGTDDE